MAGLIGAAAIAGCGTGQIAQTTDQASAVNGTEGVVGDVALRDVRIQAVQTGDMLGPGRTVDLAFVVSNQSLDTTDELTGISTDIGRVSLTGIKKLPAGGSLIVSPPAAPGSTAPSPKELRAVEDAGTATATVTLDKPISNGLTYGFTFAFKQAGPITLAVPISADGAATSATPRPHS
ncbi:MAG TPA: hypothetical protein VFR27_05480 [Mycobacterium sp.]|nr:hypothetical protein [Mycobacterium sp.]